MSSPVAPMKSAVRSPELFQVAVVLLTALIILGIEFLWICEASGNEKTFDFDFSIGQ